MRIGPVNFSYRLPVLLAVVACLVFYLWAFWRSNAEMLAESFFRDDIVRGVFDENFDNVKNAADACRKLLAVRPNKINARLYLATILLRQKENNKDALDEAQKIFKEVSTAANAKPEEKAWALVGAGVALFDTAEGTAQSQVAGECENLFKRALQQDPKNADALANLALVQPYHSPANLKEAEKLCLEASQAPQPPSLRAQAQLYSLQGWLLLCQDQAEAALAVYTRALRIRPGHEDLLQNQRLAFLNVVTQPKLDPKFRRELLQTIQGLLGQYGDYQVAALNATGHGWELLQQTPEYGATAYANAMNQFSSAIQRDPKAPSAYLSRGVLLEQQVKNLAGQLTAKIPGLNAAEAARFNPSKNKEQPLSGPDSNLLSVIKQTLQQENENWQNFREKAAKPEQKADSLLRQLSCARRILWATRESDEAVRAPLRDRALKLANELAALEPENGEAQFALGEVLLEAGQWSAAFKAMQAAGAKHASFPGLAKLLEDLGRQPALGKDVRPGPLRRSFGRLPFVAATLIMPSYLKDFKEIKLALDDKDVPVIRIGTQVFYLPENTSPPVGLHTAKFSAVDAAGVTVPFPSFQFGVERKPSEPPKITPDSPAVISTKPQWTVALNGADPNTINITLKSKALSKNRELIKDGRHKFSSPELTPPVKAGDACGEQFTFGAGLVLQPGEYTLLIEARDADGNVINFEPKIYTVQREGTGGGQP